MLASTDGKLGTSKLASVASDAMAFAEQLSRLTECSKTSGCHDLSQLLPQCALLVDLISNACFIEPKMGYPVDWRSATSAFLRCGHVVAYLHFWL